ncbi:helix-turn-helix domain-containing protein [Streptococcus hyovaginalis]
MILDKETILAITLKKYRQDNGLTQAELAEQLDVSDKTISKWENGETYPSKRNMMRLANKLDISIETLLIEDKGPTRDRYLSLKYGLIAYVIIFFVCMLMLSSKLTNDISQMTVSQIVINILKIGIKANSYSLPASGIIALVFYLYIFPKQRKDD